jgi:hypothetical protein
MWSNISKLVVAVILVVLVIGCQSKNPSPSSSSAEELRLLTPEQEKKLLEQAERVEQKEMVRQPIKNEKGEVVGEVRSQTTVIFLKPGGRFSVNTTCTPACTGVPINLKLGVPTQENSCHCNDKCDACTGAVDAQGCGGTCTQTKTGFGNFGIFIAMERENPQNTSVAHK